MKFTVILIIWAVAATIILLWNYGAHKVKTPKRTKLI